MTPAFPAWTAKTAWLNAISKSFGRFAPKLLSASTICAALAWFSFGTLGTLDAQITILHNFGDGSVPNDGVLPQKGLVQAADGNIFGITLERLKNGNQVTGIGTAFELTPGDVLTIISNFNNNLIPWGPLLVVGEQVVGFTIRGPGKPYGPNDSGTVYRLHFSAGSGTWKRNFVHEFRDGSVANDGSIPLAALIQGADGDLYGTTMKGGVHGVGTVYKIQLGSDKVTILHSFNPEKEPCIPESSLLLGKDGNYYGTTLTGPERQGGGSIFMMTPAGQVTTLYRFAKNAVAAALIQGTDGNFYGAQYAPSNKYGTVFKMTADHTVSTLHSFGTGTDGIDPLGVVQGPSGNLYGVTQMGGTTGGGVLFELSLDGSSYNILHNFHDGTVPNDGNSPSGPLIVGSDNNLYGETFVGGTANRGTIFRFSP